MERYTIVELDWANFPRFVIYWWENDQNNMIVGWGLNRFWAERIVEAMTKLPPVKA